MRANTTGGPRRLLSRVALIGGPSFRAGAGPPLVVVPVATHRLDHFAARPLALAARPGTRLHLGRVELVALGRTRLARLGTGRTGVGHERALVGDEVGREVAELRTVGHEVQGLGMLLLALGELL